MEIYNINNLSIPRGLKQYLSLLFLCAYIIYNTSLVPFGVFIPKLSIVLLASSVVFAYLSMNIIDVLKTREFKLIIPFIIISTITSQITAVDTNISNTKAQLMVESFIVGCLINVHARNERLHFICSSIFVGALYMAVHVYRNPILLFVDHGRMSINENMNANTLGVYLMFSIWCVLYTFHDYRKKILGVILSICLSLFIFYILVQTGSRKAAIGSIFLFIIFLYTNLFIEDGDRRIGVKIVLVTVIFCLLYYIYNRFALAFQDVGETLLNRMDKLDEGGENRTNIAIQALRVWEDHPILGVGIDNVRYHTASQVYAHNTYIETLAATGILGSGFFLMVYFFIYKKIITGIHSALFTISKKTVMYDICLLLLLSYIGMGQILIYNELLWMYLYILISLTNNYSRNEYN